MIFSFITSNVLTQINELGNEYDG